MTCKTIPGSKPLDLNLLMEIIFGTTLEAWVADAVAHPEKYDVWEA